MRGALLNLPERSGYPLWGSRLVKAEASVHGRVWVNRAIVEIDVLNLALLIDDESGTPRPFVVIAAHRILSQNPVRSERLAIHIAEEREGDADLLGKCGIGRRTVNADAENDGIAGIELGQISLNGLKFLGSTTGEGQNVEGEHDVLLAAIIGKGDGLSLVAGKSEVGGDVADFEGRSRHGVLLRSSGRRQCEWREQQAGKSGGREDASLHLSSEWCKGSPRIAGGDYTPGRCNRVISSIAVKSGLRRKRSHSAEEETAITCRFVDLREFDT